MSFIPSRSTWIDQSNAADQYYPLLPSETPFIHIFATVTETEYITSTIIGSSVSEQTISVPNTEANIYAEDVWEHRIHRHLPVILAFAIIGILTVLGSLVYLVYRFYQASAQSRRKHAEENDDNSDEEKKPTSPISATLSNIIPWLAISSPTRHPTDIEGPYVEFRPQQREPIRFEKSDLKRIMDDDTSVSNRQPSLATSWLTKILPNKFSTAFNFSGPSRRHMSLPILFSDNDRQAIDNLNIPISSTFVPIDKSSLKLVPRSEIWLDPHRRRGVDELDLWERKNSCTEIQTIAVPEPRPTWRFPSQQNAYPDSPESFECRISLSDRRSINIDSRGYSISQRSSTITMQDNNQPSRSRSETTRYVMDSSNNPSLSSNPAYYNQQSTSENDSFSRFQITVKLPKSKQEGASDVSLARQALETSRLQNSSV